MTTLVSSSGQIWALPALGWTLLHFCWQGAVVAAMLWCVLRLLGGRSSQMRYAAACCALALMVALPVATFGRLAGEARRLAMATPALSFDLAVTAMPGGHTETAPLMERVAQALNEAAPWVPLVWLAGVVLFLGRLSFGLAMARRMKSDRTHAVEAELLLRFDALRLRLGVTRAVRLMNSALVEVPAVIGWLRPVVLIPIGCLTGLSAIQIEALLAHELAHIRRHDYFVSVAQSVMEALLFYHPAVWWVSKQVRRERECCCDDLAVCVGGDALEYAKALSTLEARRSFYPAVALGANGGVLTMRIKRLLGYNEGSVASQVAAFAVLALLIALPGSYLIAVARAQPAPVQTAATAAENVALPGENKAVSNEPSPAQTAVRISQQTTQSAASSLRGTYTIWLDQDVRWIITAKERADFERLASDDDRDRFIARFWESRNPPGAPPNSYREEHYARIAYSNQHFAATEPGWKTDRGHIYIAYGKPDSIDSHPTGFESGYPFEVWHYRSIPGVGQNVDMEFVDTCRCGEFHYTIDRDQVDRLAPGAGSSGLQPARLSLATNALAVKRVGYQVAVAPGQSDIQGGSVTGTVSDPDGAVLPGSKITIAGADGAAQFHMTVYADGAGKYSFSSLPPGPYNIEVEARGFQTVHLQKINFLGGAQPAGLNVRLKVGTTSETLNVSSSTVSYSPPQITPAPAIPSGPVRVSSGVMANQITTRPDPAYPPIAKAAHVQGAVVLHAVIGKTGTVEQLSVISGPAMLQKAAMDAVERWTYKPYLLNGQPIEVDTTITVNFTFGGDPGTPQPEQSNGAPGSVPVRVSSGTMQGSLISRVDPVYPADAKASGVQGAVVLHALISKTGNVRDLQVISGPKELVGASLDAVNQWKYRPYLLNGEPVEVDTTVTINFTFGGGASVQKPATGSEDAPAPKRIGNGVSAPLLIYSVPPQYTEQAKESKTSGNVLVNLWVDEQGNPTHVHVVRGVGYGLDEKAVEAVKQYKFKPAMEGGNAVLVEINVEVNFQLF